MSVAFDASRHLTSRPVGVSRFLVAGSAGRLVLSGKAAPCVAHEAAGACRNLLRPLHTNWVPVTCRAVGDIGESNLASCVPRADPR